MKHHVKPQKALQNCYCNGKHFGTDHERQSTVKHMKEWDRITELTLIKWFGIFRLFIAAFSETKQNKVFIYVLRALRQPTNSEWKSYCASAILIILHFIIFLGVRRNRCWCWWGWKCTNTRSTDRHKPFSLLLLSCAYVKMNCLQSRRNVRDDSNIECHQ